MSRAIPNRPEQCDCPVCKGALRQRGRHPADPTGEIFGDNFWPLPYPHEVDELARQARIKNMPAEPVRAAQAVPTARPDHTPKASSAPVPNGREMSLADLCKELNLEPSVARRILRKKMERSDGRWVFHGAEIEQAQKILKGI